jgi:hypothetical protein
VQEQGGWISVFKSGISPQDFETLVKNDKSLPNNKIVEASITIMG